MRLSEITSQPHAIITAHRSTFDKEENAERNHQLRDALTAKGLNAQLVDGRWRKVKERSYLVQKPPEMPFDEFKKLITSLGQQFDQDAVIISDGT